MYTTLLSAQQLQALLASPKPCMVFDCSFDLSQPDAGHAMYLAGHIPGAVYADLEQHLSAPKETPSNATTKASGARHPLPTREEFAHWLGSIGFSKTTQAVVYDRQGNNYCARLWWMLQWMGHENVAVLDGGLAAWQSAAGALRVGAEIALAPAHFTPDAPLLALVDAPSVERQLGQTQQTLIDARAAPRYRGEVEPLDPVAGHIPGALNRPFTQNFTADGRFKSASVLRGEYEALLGMRAPSTVVHYCGSGVSALANLLAMEIAGLQGSALFAGSWSEWCSDPRKPVAQG